MKNKILFSLLIFLSSGVSAQSFSVTQVKFCDQTGIGKASTINLSMDQLRNCDLTISPTDSNLIVVSFKLTLILKNNKQVEIDIIGNTIPMNKRDQLINDTKLFLIEYIKAKVPDETFRMLKPLTIKIE